MTTIKGFHMKNISLPKAENGRTFRKGILYVNGEKAGFFKEYNHEKEPEVFIHPGFQDKWDTASADYFREHDGAEGVSPDTFLVNGFVELMDYEKRYKAVLRRGFPIYAVYIELKEKVISDKAVLTSTGRRVIFRTDDIAEIEELERTELATMTFERKLFCSLDDFVVA